MYHLDVASTTLGGTGAECAPIDCVTAGLLRLRAASPAVRRVAPRVYHRDVTLLGRLPHPCLLCGHREGERLDDGRWRCGVCGWRVGDVPDADLPPPRVDVVYYLRWADRIKIGTTHRPRQRLSAIRHEELLAFERGDRALEQRRHREFADLREGGEWFTAERRLLAHIGEVHGGVPPWHAYARWVAEAYGAV